LLSREELYRLSTLSIADFNIDELQEMSELDTDGSIPTSKRLELFLHNVKNPYCFKVNGTPVQISFANNGRTLEEALISYLTNVKKLDE